MQRHHNRWKKAVIHLLNKMGWSCFSHKYSMVMCFLHWTPNFFFIPKNLFLIITDFEFEKIYPGQHNLNVWNFCLCNQFHCRIIECSYLSALGFWIILQLWNIFLLQFSSICHYGQSMRNYEFKVTFNKKVEYKDDVSSPVLYLLKKRNLKHETVVIV